MKQYIHKQSFNAKEIVLEPIEEHTYLGIESKEKCFSWKEKGKEISSWEEVKRSTFLGSAGPSFWLLLYGVIQEDAGSQVKKGAFGKGHYAELKGTSLRKTEEVRLHWESKKRNTGKNKMGKGKVVEANKRTLGRNREKVWPDGFLSGLNEESQRS